MPVQWTHIGARPLTSLHRGSSLLALTGGNVQPTGGPQDTFFPPDPDTDEYEPGVGYDFRVVQLNENETKTTSETFSGDNGYLLLAPPTGDGIFRGRIDFSTNAAVVVLRGIDWWPIGKSIDSTYTPPSDPPTVNDMCNIRISGRSSGAARARMWLSRVRTTSFENGNDDYVAGGVFEPNGTSSDKSQWPLAYVENGWFDEFLGWFGQNINTRGHSNFIKASPGGMAGCHVAGCRVKTNYILNIFINAGEVNQYGPVNDSNAYASMKNCQLIRSKHPSDYDGGTVYNRSIYNGTSYANEISEGDYFPFVYLGTDSGGADGYGVWLEDEEGFSHIGDMVTPGVDVGAGTATSGPDIVGDGNPPESVRPSAHNLSLWTGTMYAGTHPRTDVADETQRPVMRNEAGAAYAIRTKDELQVWIAGGS